MAPGVATRRAGVCMRGAVVVLTIRTVSKVVIAVERATGSAFFATEMAGYRLTGGTFGSMINTYCGTTRGTGLETVLADVFPTNGTCLEVSLNITVITVGEPAATASIRAWIPDYVSIHTESRKNTFSEISRAGLAIEAVEFVGGGEVRGIHRSFGMVGTDR